MSVKSTFGPTGKCQDRQMSLLTKHDAVDVTNNLCLVVCRIVDSFLGNGILFPEEEKHVVDSKGHTRRYCAIAVTESFPGAHRQNFAIASFI